MSFGTWGHALAGSSYDKREVSFEFEEVPEASAYELELRGDTQPKSEKNPTKPLKITTKTALFSGALVPGLYKLRIRALDRRKVPGVWSEELDLTVPINSTRLLEPKNKLELASTEIEKRSVEFKWSPLNGVETYILRITSVDDSSAKPIEKQTSATSAKIDLPVGKHYQWSVEPQVANELKSSDNPIFDFTLTGGKLNSPTISRFNFEKDSELKWALADPAVTCDYQIARLDPKTKKWTPLFRKKDSLETVFKIDKTFDPGRYKIIVQAKAPRFQDSNISAMDFEIPLPEKKPEDIPGKGFPKISSLGFGLLLSSGNIGFQNLSSGVTQASKTDFTNLNFEVKQFGERIPWGFFANFNLRNFKSFGQDINLSDGSAGVQYRKLGLKRLDYSLLAGISYREQQLTAAISSTTQTSLPTTGEIGVILGGELYYLLKPKWNLRSSLLFERIQTGWSDSSFKVLPSTSRKFSALADYLGVAAWRISGGLYLANINGSYEVSSTNGSTTLQYNASLDESGLITQFAREF